LCPALEAGRETDLLLSALDGTQGNSVHEKFWSLHRCHLGARSHVCSPVVARSLLDAVALLKPKSASVVSGVANVLGRRLTCDMSQMVDPQLHEDHSLLCVMRLCPFLFGSRFQDGCRDGLVCLSLVSVWWCSPGVCLCDKGCCNGCLCDLVLIPVRGFGKTWLILLGAGGGL
jgi:hypothetical protein